MGQKRIRAKTAEELQAERVEAALYEAGQTGHAPRLVTDNPGQFLRDMYEVWHRQGGKEGGRWRNSIRKMREQWLTGRNHVPSLHQKLMGRVKLTRSDVKALVGLFLERWRYARGQCSPEALTSDGYLYFGDQDKSALKAALIRSMCSDRTKALLLPVQSVQRRTSGGDLRVESFIEGEYAYCDALITFSRARIAVGATPQQTLKGFVQFFYALFQEEEKRPKEDRFFIWVIDLGQRLLEIEDSFHEYYNAGFLSLLFKAFASFDSEADDRGFRGKLSRQLRILDASQRQKRWQWLSERSVIIAENLRLEEIDSISSKEDHNIESIRLRDSHVTQQHILPREAPPNWIGDLRSLVGKNVDMANISTTVLFRKDGWSVAGGQPREFKYYAHARVLQSPDDNFATATVQSTELSPAGAIYDDAFRLMYLAAACRLRQDYNSNPDGVTALAYLRKMDFHVLRVPDFIKIQSMGIVGGSDE